MISKTKENKITCSVLQEFLLLITTRLIFSTAGVLFRTISLCTVCGWKHQKQNDEKQKQHLLHLLPEQVVTDLLYMQIRQICCHWCCCCFCCCCCWLDLTCVHYFANATWCIISSRLNILESNWNARTSLRIWSKLLAFF